MSTAIGSTGLLVPKGVGRSDGTVLVNGRCRIETRDGYRVVIVSGLPLAHYLLGDRIGEANAMVTLVHLGWAKQVEVARAFGCSERTVRRNLRRFESGGLGALGQPRGYPRGLPRMTRSRIELVNEWKAKGTANREIARLLGVTPKAVRNLLRRMGWKPEMPEQMSLAMERASEPPTSQTFPDGDPKLSGRGADEAEGARSPVLTEEEATSARGDPNLSGLSPPVSLDHDPDDRQVDRMLACLGLLDDAAPLFASANGVQGAGVLLAVPALVASGVLEIAEEVYGSLAPAFYGLRTTMMTLLLAALLRIKRPEGLKEHSPRQFGRLLGLDRAPEVRTLRRKLRRLASSGRSTELGRALARRRVESHGHAIGFLYVDGHVRAYHGKREIPKTHIARMRISMPATTDYWVNDAEGDPLFLVTSEANRGLATMLPVVLEEVRKIAGGRRITVVFDRGGWSPRLFAKILEMGFDILTYRKGPTCRLPLARFAKYEGEVEGRIESYMLADQGTYLLYGRGKKRKRLHLRQITRLTDTGHQTPIVTSRNDLSAFELAHRMFRRWRQENFFKYLREEYALDALVDYGTEPANPERDVPNPERRKLDAKLREARARLAQLQAEYGLEAIENVESLRKTMRGFKVANAALSDRVFDAMRRVVELEERRSRTPMRVPVRVTTQEEVIKLAVERKMLTDILKMVAYQAESEIVRHVADQYRRATDEGRTLVQNTFALSGNLSVTERELRVELDPLSAPHKTSVLRTLCDTMNATSTLYPGTNLRLRFVVQDEPAATLAFPGARQSRQADRAPQPDI